MFIILSFHQKRRASLSGRHMDVEVITNRSLCISFVGTMLIWFEVCVEMDDHRIGNDEIGLNLQCY